MDDTRQKDMAWLQAEYHKCGSIIQSARDGRFGNTDVKPLIYDLWLYQAKLLGWMHEVANPE